MPCHEKLLRAVILTRSSCDNCRRRRVCCLRNEDEPCALCQSRGLSCTFLSLPNPRTRRPSSENPRRRRVDDNIVVHARLIPPSAPWPTRIQLGEYLPADPGTESREPLTDDTSDSSLKTLQFVGLSGDQDPFILQYLQTKRIRGNDGIQWTCQRFGNDPRFPASFTAVPDQHLDAHPTYYPLDRVRHTASPHNDRLVKAFFEVVHPSLPILDPQLFSWSEAPSSLLAGVLALAHPYCHDAQSINPWQFMDFNSQALPIESRNAKLETVEAALLHAQRHTYMFRAPTMPGMWAEVGSIVGMSQDVGLNIDPSKWSISDDEKKRRKRLWWAVYIQDKWTALTLGRPSYIHDDQYDAEPLETTDMVPDLKTASSIRDLPARTFVAAARLTVILSDILSRLYTVMGAKRLDSMELNECHDIANTFLSRLDRWKEEYLAPLLELDVVYDPTGKPRTSNQPDKPHCNRLISNRAKEIYSSPITPWRLPCVEPFYAPLPARTLDHVQLR